MHCRLHPLLLASIGTDHKGGDRMNRANPKDLHNALVTANSFVKAGILFVAVPVTDQADYSDLLNQAGERLEKLEQQADREVTP
jgi:hypothetical protein